MDPIEARAQAKRSYPKVVLKPEHLAGTTVLPTREDLLDRLPKHGIAAEIGVAFGDFTAEILRRNQPAKLHLIDLWGSERYSPGFVKINATFESQIESGMVEINRGMSVDVLTTMPDDYFDWIYIDTDHSYKTTAKELRIGATKVKSNGRILGHDFTTGNVVTPVPYGVIEACHEFCRDEGWRYEYLTLEPHGHLSFCLIRIEP